MKIVTHNINGIRARLPRVLSWLASEQPDIVCLQELKAVEEKFPALEFEAVGYRSAVNGQPAYNGVAILAREEPKEIERRLVGDPEDDQARFLDVRVAGIRVLDVYVPNGREVASAEFARKLRWLERLRRYLEERCSPGEPLVLCGDFNIAPEDRDVYDPEAFRGKTHCTPEERGAFRALLEWGLTDSLRTYTREDGLYTWWDYRGGGFWKNHGMRIDHMLITEPLLLRLETVAVDRAERKGEKPSDHAPVVLTLE